MTTKPATRLHWHITITRETLTRPTQEGSLI